MARCAARFFSAPSLQRPARAHSTSAPLPVPRLMPLPPPLAPRAPQDYTKDTSLEAYKALMESGLTFIDTAEVGSWAWARAGCCPRAAARAGADGHNVCACAGGASSLLDARCQELGAGSCPAVAA